MELSFNFSKTFRFELINNHAKAETVLYVLHGYGQLVKYFIRKFGGIPDDIMIVAPEGMHRFYLKGASGRVGASWMTKELRETDIQDNIDWLNALDEKISSEYPIKRRYLLGFSQGGSTAIRWAIHGKPKFEALFIWASDFPPEEKVNAHLLSCDEQHFFMGSNDEFFDELRQKELITYYENIGFKISAYLGTHDIQNETLLKVFNRVHKN